MTCIFSYKRYIGKTVFFFFGTVVYFVVWLSHNEVNKLKKAFVFDARTRVCVFTEPLFFSRG